jgi:predicted acylesterase/phospholipase RssA
VAVVVGAGGVLGAAHVGIGYALEHRGFVPDMIIGTSVGALNGAIAAAHPDRAAPWLDHVWTRLPRREVYPLGHHLFSRASIFTDRGLRRLITRAGLPSRIEQLSVPFTAVAMDLATGNSVLLDHGDLESALLASAAIPGMLPPVVRGADARRRRGDRLRPGTGGPAGRGGKRGGSVDRAGELTVAPHHPTPTCQCHRRPGRDTVDAPSDRA